MLRCTHRDLKYAVKSCKFVQTKVEFIRENAQCAAGRKSAALENMLGAEEDGVSGMSVCDAFN